MHYDRKSGGYILPILLVINNKVDLDLTLTSVQSHALPFLNFNMTYMEHVEQLLFGETISVFVGP